MPLRNQGEVITVQNDGCTPSFLSFNGKSPQTAEAAFVAPSAVLVGDVRLGRNSSIWFGSVLRGDINFISIGEGTNIQDGCMLHVTSKLPVIVENDVTVGHGAILHGCKVGRGSMIAMGAIVLDGAEIGEHSVVAAGCLVPQGKKIPPGSMVMGIPAKVVRKITPEEIKGIKENTETYIDLARSY